jgi:phosphate transport system substrate-binding protein
MALMTGLAIVLIGALLVAGCTSTSDGPATTTQTSGTPPHTTGTASGRLSVTGSTTVLPVAQALAEQFMTLNPNADIQISGGGSSVGITSVGEKTAEIGMSSRELKADEKAKYPALRPTEIARDGIVMIVNPSNTMPSLTIEQIRGIYAGTTTNWQQVGGSDRPVVAIGRDSASGTREFFNEKVMGTMNTMPTMLEKNSNGAIQTAVGQNPNAIGYVGLGFVDATVRAVPLSVNGTTVAPTVENVVGGTYPLARDLYFVTNGEATGLAKEFIDFALSSEGQQIVEREGFVSITQ